MNGARKVYLMANLPLINSAFLGLGVANSRNCGLISLDDVDNDAESKDNLRRFIAKLNSMRAIKLYLETTRRLQIINCDVNLGFIHIFQRFLLLIPVAQRTDWIMFSFGTFVPILRDMRAPLRCMDEFIACYHDNYPAPFDPDKLSAQQYCNIIACFDELNKLYDPMRAHVAQALRYLLESANPFAKGARYWTFRFSSDCSNDSPAKIFYFGATWTANSNSSYLIRLMGEHGVVNGPAIDETILTSPICFSITRDTEQGLRFEQIIDYLAQDGIRGHKMAYMFPRALIHISASGKVTRI